MKHIINYVLFESIEQDLRTGTDLQADFDMINDKLFGGEIRRVPLRWMNSKINLGLMSYTEDGTIKDIAISYKYKVTRQQYLDTMAHEMIHVYLEQKGVRERDHHGPRFIRMAEEINRKFPEFEIRAKQQGEKYHLANAEEKTYGVVLFEIDSEYSVVVFQEKVLDDEKTIEEFVQGLKGARGAFLTNKSVLISIYRSNAPSIAKFKVKKSLSLKSMELFVIDAGVADEIRKSVLVREDKIK